MPSLWVYTLNEAPPAEYVPAGRVGLGERSTLSRYTRQRAPASKRHAARPTRTATMSVSFATEIRPLFREKDIAEMIDVMNLDLASYEAVRDHADAIHAQVASGWMPCDLPWGEEQVALFKQWIDGGFAP